jgi:hypothetical protein
MGIFYDMVEVRNLAPINLTVTFDGQEKTLPPGVSVVPKQVVPFAMNQNPVMGKQDPNNPHISGGEYLVVPVGTKYDREPLTAEEWAEHLGRPCRVDEVAIFDEKYGGDPKAKMLARGKKGKPAAKSLYEAGKNPQGLASFENRE